MSAAEPPTPPTLSIIIVTWNVAGPLHDCLASLRSAAPDAEVIVVDNASTDGTEDLVRTRHPGVRFIRNAVNSGFARANNQGLEVARGRYLLLLNPDTIVPENAIRDTLAFAAAHPEVGVTGCILRNADGSLQKSAHPIPSPLYEVAVALGLSILYGSAHRRLGPGREYAPAGFLTGAFLLFPREVYEAVGPLDDGAFMYGEDVDWCYRVRRSGHEVALFGGASITHLGGASADQAFGTTRQERVYRAQNRFQRRHFGRWAAVAPVARAIGLAVRIIPDAVLSFEPRFRRRCLRHVRAFGANLRAAREDAARPPLAGV